MRLTAKLARSGFLHLSIRQGNDWQRCASRPRAQVMDQGAARAPAGFMYHCPGKDRPARLPRQ